jgi:hypothetical protein
MKTTGPSKEAAFEIAETVSSTGIKKVFQVSACREPAPYHCLSRIDGGHDTVPRPRAWMYTLILRLPGEGVCGDAELISKRCVCLCYGRS